MASESVEQVGPVAPGPTVAPEAPEPARVPGAAGDVGWRDRLETLDWREPAILAGIVAVSVLLRVLTWNVVADGDRGPFLKTTLFGACAAVVVWALVRLQTGPRSWVPILSGAAVLLSGDAVHYVRLANPISHGGPVQSFTGSLADPVAARRQWYVETGGDGKVLFEPGAVVLETPPNSTAFIIARLDGAADVGTRWWLPVALAQQEPREELTWRASIRRTGGYLVVTEVRNLLIQAVSYGLHVTYPDAQGAVRGYEVPHATVLDGRPHEWRITRDSREIVISIDGNRTWAAPQRGPLNQLKLGETKIDPEHSGTVRVEAIGYASYLQGG